LSDFSGFDPLPPELMHRFSSHHAIRRMRVTALLLVVKCALIPCAAVVLAWAVIDSNMELAFLGLVMAGLGILVLVLQWVIAARANCPLCITPVMASKGCSLNRKAKSFLGNYQLRVALAVLFTGSFRCPYCGEPSILEVRQHRRH
jgi:hypothetical protein